MIYLVKNLSKTYDIVISNINKLPMDLTHHLVNSTYFVNGTLFANIFIMPFELAQGSSNQIDQHMSNTVDNLYNNNHEKILLQNKNKFIIAVIQFKPDGSKEVLYANSYVNLLNDETEYQKLLATSPMHHYEIFNYKTGTFDIFITKDLAIEKLVEYIDEFIIEYKPNIVKKFLVKEEFLEYIK
jgi:hypothetical protein